MAETPLASKLQIKPGFSLLLLNTPKGYEKVLGKLPDGAMLATSAKGTYDWVLLFCHNQTEIDQHALAAIKHVKPGGQMWFAYPKKSGSIKTDISRDKGWDGVVKAGWEGVRQIAIDDTWSALRFRPLSEIKSLTRQAYRDKQK